MATCNRERHDDPVPLLQVSHLRSDIDDLAHELVAQDITLLHCGNVTVVDVQVGATDRRRCNLDNSIARVKNTGISYRLNAYIMGTIPTECSHNNLLICGH